MPRAARARSESGFYHVVAKGNGGQNLFEDASDYRAFLELVGAAAEKRGVLVHAYCLMSNHVHLLLEDRGNRLSDFMKSLITGYAMRFNAKTGHIGHVFQQRFKSQPVESEAYLLQAARYIHNNPAKAGVCSADEYLWSSYHEYASGVRGITAVSLILELCGGREGFRAFQAQREGDYRFAQRSRVTDAEACEVARRILGDIAPGDIKAMERPRRNALLFDLKDAGLSVRQIERLTGIGRGTIAKS